MNVSKQQRNELGIVALIAVGIFAFGTLAWSGKTSAAEASPWVKVPGVEACIAFAEYGRTARYLAAEKLPRKQVDKALAKIYNGVPPDLLDVTKALRDQAYKSKLDGDKFSEQFGLACIDAQPKSENPFLFLMPKPVGPGV